MAEPPNASKPQDTCRICRSSRLRVYLDLGRTPLANAYLKEEDRSGPEFAEELALQLCEDCGLSQLTKVVHPDLMFKNYLYVSSTTETFRSHCMELATTAVARANCRPSDLVLDIASNDGCLLSKFRDVGMRVVGVDPAENLAAEANKAGVSTLCAYWSSDVADTVISRFGRPKVITGTNVFAHADDVHEFVRAVTRCLAPGGFFIIECPYIVDFIERTEFDTAYHEHLSYLGIHSLRALMAQHGLVLVDVEYFKDIHGGTIRVFSGRPGEHTPQASVDFYLRKEAAFGILDFRRYQAFGNRVGENKERLLKLVHELDAQGRAIWAYGASAKGNTLMNYFGISRDLIPVVVDDNPKKWGWYTPGSHMRITGIEELSRSKVDFLLLLAWNFEAEIRRRCRAIDYRGAFILPVPEVTVLS